MDLFKKSGQNRSLFKLLGIFSVTSLCIIIVMLVGSKDYVSVERTEDITMATGRYNSEQGEIA